MDDSLALEWMTSVGLDDRALFLRRLAWDDLTPERAAVVFETWSGPADPHQFDAIQEWLRASSPISARSDGPSPPTVSFAELWQRIASGAMAQLLRDLPTEVTTCFGSVSCPQMPRNRVYAALHQNLVVRLARAGEAVLWKVFTGRRAPDQIVFAHLGDSPAAPGQVRRSIYCRLLEELRGDALSGLVEKYPVLRTHLSTTVDQWSRNCRDLLSRVHADLPQVIEAFDLPADVELADLTLGLSDPHRGGQSVATLWFKSASPGPSYPVVCKPKDLDIDQAFQSLLHELLPPQPDDEPLRSAVVLTRPGYGYMEHISHSLCRDEEQLARFTGMLAD